MPNRINIDLSETIQFIYPATDFVPVYLFSDLDFTRSWWHMKGKTVGSMKCYCKFIHRVG